MSPREWREIADRSTGRVGECAGQAQLDRRALITLHGELAAHVTRYEMRVQRLEAALESLAESVADGKISPWDARAEGTRLAREISDHEQLETELEGER